MIDVKICGLSPTTQAALIEVFRAFPSVIQVKLFGSRAMGRYREGSDIDLALITGPFNHSDFLRLSQKIDDLLLPYKVDLVAIHEIDNLALLDHINRVGIDFLQ